MRINKVSNQKLSDKKANTGAVVRRTHWRPWPQRELNKLLQQLRRQVHDVQKIRLQCIRH